MGEAGKEVASGWGGGEGNGICPAKHNGLLFSPLLR